MSDDAGYSWMTRYLYNYWSSHWFHNNWRPSSSSSSSGAPNSRAHNKPSATLPTTPAILRLESSSTMTMMMTAAAHPGTSAGKSSVVIVDDSAACSADKKVRNLVGHGGAAAVVLYSAAATGPKLLRSSSFSAPVLGVGPTRNQQGHVVVLAGAYLPRAASPTDPSVALLVALATFAFAVGGSLSGASFPQFSSAAVSSSSGSGSIFTMATTTSPVQLHQRNSIRHDAGAAAPDAGFSLITSVGDLLKMVGMMSVFLVGLYLGADHVHRLDSLVCLLVAPHQLATLADRLLFRRSSPLPAALASLFLSSSSSSSSAAEEDDHHIDDDDDDDSTSYYYSFEGIRHAAGAWVFQDAVGVAMAVNGLLDLRLPSMRLVATGLGLVFCYDVFFVFVTPLLTSDGVSVMERVAVSSASSASSSSSSSSSKHAGGDDDAQQHYFNAAPTWPNILVVPAFHDALRVCNVRSFVLLGVGDIFWPGLASSYAFAFDRVLVSLSSSSSSSSSVIGLAADGWHRQHAYFLTAVLAYAAGLALSMLASLWLQTGQPALLYIVPAVLAPLLLLAKSRRQLDVFWDGSLFLMHRH
ncbi:unnamed protein product [Notodromas monacha]|uniref:Uncharacterized protein n=1 Tax=Notodromas monacha TaxID=399045 RepID=A0A7R9BE23_9CRUS|nr:unnamed protein product [Notodromas monacha]CAG0913677.1 unnamed protein product [Notodromas monacha]